MSLYDTDFYAWAASQAALLKAGRFDELDLANLAEEVEDLSRSDRRQLLHRLIVLISHLLKFEYQPEQRSVSWHRTIRHQRTALYVLFYENLSLKRFVPEYILPAYSRARIEASNETNKPLGTFPPACPYQPDQILADDFWPEA